MVPRFLLNEGVRKTGVCSKFYPKVTVPSKRGNFSPLLSHKTVKMVNFILSAFHNLKKKLAMWNWKGQTPGGILADGPWGKGQVRDEQGAQPEGKGRACP